MGKRKKKSGPKRAWERYVRLWKELKGWKLFWFTILHYTLLFVVMSDLIFAPYRENGKTFLWNTDAISQYFPHLLYVSQTVRDGIQSLLHGEGWTIPLYDFRTIPAETELQFEPIQWLAVLCPSDKLDSLYDILVLVRFYLVGVSFSLLGFYFHQKPLPVVIGAVSYTFCGFAIYAGVRHPQFLAPMIFLPLLVIGAEKILRKERAFLFTVMVFLSLLSSLYFSCMFAILLVLYLLVRYFCAFFAGEGFSGFWRMIGRAAIWGGAGILLSGVVTVPTLLQMLGTGRIGRDVGDMLRYADSYYERFLSSFTVIPGAISWWTCLGFSVLAVPALCILYFNREKSPEKRTLRVLFAIMTIMMCIPAVSYVMSGFNAFSNRWCFAYALCVSAITMFELPQLQTENKNVLFLAIGGSIAYLAACYIFISDGNFHWEPFILLSMALSSLGVCYAAGPSGRKAILSVCLVITCLSTYYCSYLMYDPDEKDYVSEFITKGEVYTTYENGQYASLGSSERVRTDDSVFRVAASNLNRESATLSFYWDLNGLTYYTSSLFTSYKDLQVDTESLRRFHNNWEYHTDARAPLLSLLNVKYYAVRGNSAARPYGFQEMDRVQNGKNTDVILENAYALPMGYTYDTYLPEKEYEALSTLEKQEALLQSIVLAEKPDTVSVNEGAVETVSRKLTTEIVETNGLTWQNGKLKVAEENATLTLAFQGLPGADTYLRVVNLDLTSGQSTRRWNLTATTDSTTTYGRFTADGWLYSNGAKTQLMYLGNTEDGFTTCTLTFPSKGTFILDDLEIWCQPMDHYGEQIDALRAEPLENIETNWRGLTGTVSLSKDKILCFSLPYDTGWSVYVDGEKRDLNRANVGLMAVELEAGDHTIELKYWLPGLTAGILLSCAGLAGTIFLVIYHKKHKEGKRGRHVAV